MLLFRPAQTAAPVQLPQAAARHRAETRVAELEAQLRVLQVPSGGRQ